MIVKLTAREAAKVVQTLEVTVVQGHNHVRGFVVIDGKKVLPVHYASNVDELSNAAMHLFRRSLGLTTLELAELLKSTMTKLDYVRLIKDKGIA